MSSNAQRRPVRKRVRLTPDIRIGLILDAALAEFSRNGFAATRIEDIAAHAGLSKAGLYAHFASKEAIFEALLVRTLSLPISTPPPELEMGAAALDVYVSRFVDRLYERFDTAATQATLRLLMTESERLGGFVMKWRDEVLLPYLGEQERLLREAVAKGVVRESVLSECFMLTFSPWIHCALRLMLDPEASRPQVLDGMKRSHARLLMELLSPVRLDAAGLGDAGQAGDGRAAARS